MSELNLEAIKARCEAATPGPWRTYCSIMGDPIVVCEPGPKRRRTLIYGFFSDGDQKFVARAREDIPMLVAEVERLQAALAKALSETNEPDDFVELFGRFPDR